MQRKYFFITLISLLTLILTLNAIEPLNVFAQSDNASATEQLDHKKKDDDDGKSCECDGKITTLSLKYNGGGSPTIKVDQKDGATVFEQTVNSENSFTINGADKKGTLGTEISIFINDTLSVKIHTSCSQEINIGQVFGSFTVTNGQSRNNGQICGGTNTNTNSNTNVNTNTNTNMNSNVNTNSNENNNTNENEPGTDIPEVSYPALLGMIGGGMLLGALIGFFLGSNNNKTNKEISIDEKEEDSKE